MELSGNGIDPMSAMLIKKLRMSHYLWFCIQVIIDKHGRTSHLRAKLSEGKRKIVRSGKNWDTFIWVLIFH